MSILSVVRDVCLAIGVNPPTSMFSPAVQPRTQNELLSLANEMAQRIAYDIREWRALKATNTFFGNGVIDVNGVITGSITHALPANFKRMLLSSNVYPSWVAGSPMQFIPDTDEWLARRMNGETFGWGEWTLIGNDMLIHPILMTGTSVTFVYLDKNCVKLNSGGYGSEFTNDADEYRLDERLLKLGMIWQWKANKGSPYAEDLGTYSDALVMVAGADAPASVIVSDGRWKRYNAGYVQ